MQTAATILMSLGADLVNAGQISSSQAGTPDMSFAQSFDESAARIIEAQPRSLKTKCWRTRQVLKLAF